MEVIIVMVLFIGLIASWLVLPGSTSISPALEMQPEILSTTTPQHSA